MKFGNPKSQQIQDAAVLVAGAIAGGAVSRGVIGLIHKPSGATDDATLKKEGNMLLLKRLAIAAAAVYGAAAISGNDSASKAVQGSLVGMAVVQVLDTAKDMAAKNAKLSTPTTATQKFAAHALGLGCACDTPGMGKPYRRRASLRGYEPIMPGQESIFDVAIAQGSRIAS
jgi:hypothetical protein